MDFYTNEQRLGAAGDAMISAIVLGIMSLALFFLDLPTAWHLTVVICVSVTLLAYLVAHGIQGIVNQVHLSGEYLARVIAERGPD